jgi:outer membrane lipoprotein-sorting protein
MVFCVMAGAAWAQVPTTAPATAPATAATQAAVAAAEVDKVLDALHAAGVNLRDFVAEVSLAEEDMISGDSATRRGTVWYQLKSPGQARIRVDFPIKQVGDLAFKDQRIEYLLDDGWLWDRDFKNKVQVKRQVLKEGQKINLLKLGEGPFPLPIGQERQDVLRMFRVTLKPLAKGEPADTVHLQLIPDAKTNAQFARRFKSLDVWVDLRQSFPVRIDTVDADQKTQRSTQLKLRSINSGLKDSDFALEELGKDWRQRLEPFEQ